MTFVPFASRPFGHVLSHLALKKKTVPKYPRHRLPKRLAVVSIVVNETPLHSLALVNSSRINSPMALRESEALVLRTYPLREADLLVTFFTRMEGKVRGVARSAKKSKRRFGGALEPLTYVRAFYDVRERQE